MTFDNAALLKLLQHSFEAQTRNPNFVQLGDKSLRKPGQTQKDYGSLDDVDLTKVPPGLWLVGDEGVYVMSNGLPALKNDDSGTGSVCVYAKEADPTRNAEEARIVKEMTFGSDDGCDFMEGEGLLRLLLAAPDRPLRVSLTPDAMTMTI
nr:DUF3085 domain-containing protein [Neokomagataea anthophila]